ncbi:MAG: Crp/Fnr family transcriptional regulator [Gammaproteobacteria bacterium]|nr:Crp/Fnr family transcriptional regulator [Gammaproteobacteria bacterium]
MASPDEQLLAIWRHLGSGERATLLAFAEFLQQRETTPNQRPVPSPPARIAEPEVIERPAEETVVAALKRLSKTYPMIDKSEMLSATSDLVATHIMQGTETSAAIDQLEEIFSEHYRQLRERGN